MKKHPKLGVVSLDVLRNKVTGESEAFHLVLGFGSRRSLVEFDAHGLNEAAVITLVEKLKRTIEGLQNE